MKKVLLGVLAACAITPAFAQTSVGVSIGINQPGVYGRINIGDVPTTAPRAEPEKAVPSMPRTTPTPTTRHTLRRISLLP